MANDTVRKLAHGFSLIEIMIALVISLILLAGVFTIMSSSKRTYALQAELAKVQENARFAMEEIAYGLRMAGYAGCSGTLLDNQAPLVGNSRAIRKATRQSNGTYKLANATGLGESDVLTVTFFDEELPVKDNVKKVEENDRLKDFLDFEGALDTIELIMLRQPAERTLILSDCGGAETFKITGSSADNARVQRQNVTQKSIFEPVEVFVSAPSYRYEIAKIERTDGQEVFGLFFSTDQGTTFRLLVEGVREMRLSYGVDAKNDGRNIQIVNNPVRKVRNVRVSLLMRTIERRYDLGYQLDKDGKKLKGLDLDGPIPFKFDPEEGYRYRLFSTLVQVRNGNG